MNCKKKSTPNNTTGKQNISIEQQKLMFLKKKKCETLALRIVECLIEPNIRPEWLLPKLKHISKCHMEDIIEERAISKVCGYVLCSKSLTTVFKQRYYISTKQNKVYDLGKRKNFCSAQCYGASNYLFEQLLDSPLWLRDQENMPEFKFLTKEEKVQQAKMGEEIQVNDEAPDRKSLNRDNTSGTSDKKKIITSDAKQFNNESINVEHDKKKLIETNINDILQTLQSSEDLKLVTEPEKYTKTEQIDSQKIKVSKNHKSVKTIDENEKIVVNEKNEAEPIKELDKKPLIERVIKLSPISTELTLSAESSPSKINHEQEKTTNLNVCKKMNDKRIFQANPVTRVEKNFKEWVTKDTIKLLTGDKIEKQHIFDKVLKSERYNNLCEKLNRLEILDENDQSEINPNEKTRPVKPLPNYTYLQEESKRMELKVQAFFKGNTTIKPLDTCNTSSNEEEKDQMIVPVTEANAPNAIRRKILLDKLNKVVPDLLRTLSLNSNYSDQILAVKVLVHTFSISPSNVMFRSIEWTLVGLIIIKMLSYIHSEAETSLKSCKSDKFIKMILMTYKLDENYLNTFVSSLIKATI